MFLDIIATIAVLFYSIIFMIAPIKLDVWAFYFVSAGIIIWRIWS